MRNVNRIGWLDIKCWLCIQNKRNNVPVMTSFCKICGILEHTRILYSGSRKSPLFLFFCCFWLLRTMKSVLIYYDRIGYKKVFAILNVHYEQSYYRLLLWLSFVLWELNSHSLPVFLFNPPLSTIEYFTYTHKLDET